MNKIFNTTFENSLRVLLLLSVDEKPKSLDMITTLDFIAIYNKTLLKGEKDLHGHNTFAFCEYTAKREIVNRSIKQLVLKGLINIEKLDKGFYYKINQNGKEVVNSFTSSYKEQYIKAAKCSIDFSKRKTEKTLLNFINQKAIELGGMDE